MVTLCWRPKHFTQISWEMHSGLKRLGPRQRTRVVNLFATASAAHSLFWLSFVRARYPPVTRKQSERDTNTF